MRSTTPTLELQRHVPIKIEQLLRAQYRASISENILEGGHSFVS
jgi:hypothetical protein